MSAATVRLKDGRLAKLGRVRPKQIVHTDRFTVLRTPDDRVKCIPQLGFHFERPRRPRSTPLTTNWAAAAMAAIRQTYGNTEQGDCVIASKLHSIGIWTANESGIPALSTDAEALQTYHDLCGRGDEGCVITDVLDRFKTAGLPCGGVTHRLDNYVSIDWTNPALVQAAVEVFGGGMCLGINLPSEWTCTDCVWPAAASGNVGGHDVPVVDVDPAYVSICTWGGIARIENAGFFSRSFIEEAYCMLSPDWYSSGGVSASGINQETLAADLALVAGGATPPLASLAAHLPALGNVGQLLVTSALMPGNYNVSQPLLHALAGGKLNLTPAQWQKILAIIAAVVSAIAEILNPPAPSGGGGGGCGCGS